MNDCKYLVDRGAARIAIEEDEDWAQAGQLLNGANCQRQSQSTSLSLKGWGVAGSRCCYLKMPPPPEG